MIRILSLTLVCFPMFASMPAFAQSNLEQDFFISAFDKADKKGIFSTLVSEATRIDGDALWCRKNRAESWEETTELLSNEIYQEIRPLKFGRLLQRLDATYPSLHAKIELPEELNYRKKALEKKLHLEFSAEVRSIEGDETSFFITKVDTAFSKRKSNDQVQIGDRITAINGKPIDSWREENFLFCKFALKAQCDTELFNNFRSGLLSFDFLNEASISLTLERHNKSWNLTVPIVADENKSDKKSDIFSCAEIANRDYRNYKLIFGDGRNICLFENKNAPTIALMRIFSFVPEEHNGKVFSPQEEADLLFPFWKKVSAKYKKLIVDVSGNRGGDIPGPITALIVNRPFQDQWMQFKKTKEFENIDFRSKHFTNGRMTEKAYAQLEVWQKWQDLKYGDYLPPVPQFCVADGKDCLTDLYQPAQHGFSGNVAVVVDQWCVSSCSGFVWTLKNYIDPNKIKFIGFPDSADTTYERYRINVWLAPHLKTGFELSVQPRQYRPDDYQSMLALSWLVSATRTTDHHGAILSMTPLAVNQFIPWRNDKKRWLQEALAVAEKD